MSWNITKNLPLILNRFFLLVIPLVWQNCTLIATSHVLLGGNLATVIERQLRNGTKPVIRGVALLCPLLQLVHFRLPSYSTYLPYEILSLLSEDLLTQMTNFYLNTSFTSDDLFNNRHLSSEDYQNFYSKLNLSLDNDLHQISQSHRDTEKLFDEKISPLLADENVFIDSPSTFLAACTYDVLLSDVQLFYQRLQTHQVKDVIYREYPVFHGAISFVDFPLVFDDAFEIMKDCAQFILNRTTTSPFRS